MATWREWRRDFLRLKKWEKVGTIIGILSLFAASGLVLGIYVNIYINTYENTTIETTNLLFSNSSNTGNICVDCENVSQVIKQEIRTTPMNYKVIEFSIQNISEMREFPKQSFRNVKIENTPLHEHLVIPFLEINATYKIGECTPDYSDCYIYQRYRVENYAPEEICYTITSGAPFDMTTTNNEACEDEYTLRALDITNTENITYHSLKIRDLYGNEIFFELLLPYQKINYGVHDPATRKKYITPQYRFTNQTAKEYVVFTE